MTLCQTIINCLDARLNLLVPLEETWSSHWWNMSDKDKLVDTSRTYCNIANI